MADIFAVVSLLSEEAHNEVTAVWNLLEQRFGLRAAQESLYPHITYFVGEGGDLSVLHECVAEAAYSEQPLSVALDGPGLFPLNTPVLFLRAVRSAALVRLHNRVLDAARCAGTTLWPHYAPSAWVPHVTLALRDLQPRHVPAVLAELRSRRTRLQTPLRDIHLVRVRRPLANSEYVGVFPLGLPDHEGRKARRR